MKILIVSPHRDDAAFSLGLGIRAWLAAGHAVEVVNCFTRSDYAPFSDAESLHENDRMTYVSALRAREDQAWKRTYGALAKKLTITDLNLKDAPRRLRIPLSDICTAEVTPIDQAPAKIAKALSAITMDAMLIPLAIGGHIDHRIARDAALSIAQPDLPRAFFEDLPYAAREDAPAQIEPQAIALDATVTPAIIGTSADAFACKLRMAECYDSQMDHATCQQIARFSERYAGAERIWANPAWLRALP